MPISEFFNSLGYKRPLSGRAFPDGSSPESRLWPVHPTPVFLETKPDPD
jgi:hypothetical protein